MKDEQPMGAAAGSERILDQFAEKTPLPYVPAITKYLETV
jgi:hypothetical protein